MLFCNEPAGTTNLHEASTHKLDMKVRRCALQLEDRKLLAKLSAGDMIALEAKCHRNCLTTLYNKARQATEKQEKEENYSHLHGIAFAELVAYMEEMRDEESVSVFKLTDVVSLYKKRLQQLGVTVGNRIHNTRLKIRLLSALPDLTAHVQRREILFTFEEDIGLALIKACDGDSDAVHLMRAAQVIRKELLNIKIKQFDGFFTSECQRDSVPSSLSALVNMVEDGPNIKHQTQLASNASTTAALSVSQLVVFNNVKQSRNSKPSVNVRHDRGPETPLPLYLGLKVHAVTRSKTLVDTLFHLGLCITYDRVLQIQSDIANGVCQRYEMEKVVCPPNMRRGLFTIAAVDNIDHNPSSATAKDSFYGTGISLMQHQSQSFHGYDRDWDIIGSLRSSTRSVSFLPSAYTSIPPAAIKTKQFTAPRFQGQVTPANLVTGSSAVAEEYDWLNAVVNALKKGNLAKDEWVSWSAYHASIQTTEIPPATINALLPLFLENAHSVAMIKHSMDIVKTSVQYLNPGQIPVVTADQPLFALAKQFQWTWSATHGEDQFVIIFGGLHIEMAVLKVNHVYVTLYQINLCLSTA